MFAHHGSAQLPAPRAMGFEVASIKLSKTVGPQGVQVNYLPGGRFSAKAAPIPILIGEAYEIDWRGRVALSPEFTKSHAAPSEQYDIEAIAAKDAIPVGASLAMQKEILRGMLKSLLADRFKLVLRQEMQQMPVFAIVVAKKGPKLKLASTKPDECTGKANVLGDGISCHSFQVGSGPEIGLHGQAVSISDLAALLSGNIGRPVVDKSGLTGLYDIQTAGFDGASSQLRASPGGVAPEISSAPGAINSEPRLSLSEVIEQLGLSLESQSAPVERFVIEHIDAPTEN